MSTTVKCQCVSKKITQSYNKENPVATQIELQVPYDQGLNLFKTDLGSLKNREKMIKFSKSPLPFQGQKRNLVRHFAEALITYPSTGVYVDLFGGSGLLSHTVKTIHPDARVIYNDFDGFRYRLDAIPETNKLLSKMRIILADHKKEKRIIEPQREYIIGLLKDANRRGYVDWITLSSALMFSGKYGACLADFQKASLYNKIVSYDYNATGYLKGVDVVQLDYQELFRQYKDVDHVVFLVDPPYLSTDVSTYSNANYWRLIDYLNILNVIRDCSYFYFTSNKSQIPDIYKWLNDSYSIESPFSDTEKVAVRATVNNKSEYLDIMYYRNNMPCQEMLLF